MTSSASRVECVRGMDHSFGHNEQSRPEHFLPRDELLWMVTDIAAKGGNLLLNVGPRGVDAQIPGAQVTAPRLVGRMGRAAPRRDRRHPPVGHARHDDPRRVSGARYTARNGYLRVRTGRRRTGHPHRGARDTDDRS